ncbi:MAG: hypothetical protein E7466_04085 [Ruminococcaceae bacterium]|nr:hypothetical protein [Oscillospiraceae bacterium]
MICKWCGGTVKAGDKKCARCGREIPALSDCGGFYGLVSNPAPLVAAAPVAAPAAPPAPDPQELARRAAAKKKAEQMALMRLGIFALVALVIVIMLIVLMVRQGDLDKRLNGMEKDMDMLNSKFSSHLQDNQMPERPDDRPAPVPDDKFEQFPNQDDKHEQQKPTEPSTDAPVELPQEPEVTVPDSWGFTVQETPANGSMFIKDKSRFDGLDALREALISEKMEGGICFANYVENEDGNQVYGNRVEVVPTEDNGVYKLEIKLLESFIDNYDEFQAGTSEDFDDAVLSDRQGNPLNWHCQYEQVTSIQTGETITAGVRYTLEVSEEIYTFFTNIMDGEQEAAASCVLEVVQTEDGKSQTFGIDFQLADAAEPEQNTEAQPDTGVAV